MPHQQLRSQALLELAHLLRDRRLTDIQFTGGAPEVPGARYAVEVAQLAQVQRPLVQRRRGNLDRDVEGVHWNATPQRVMCRREPSVQRFRKPGTPPSLRQENAPLVRGNSLTRTSVVSW